MGREAAPRGGALLEREADRTASRVLEGEPLAYGPRRSPLARIDRSGSPGRGLPLPESARAALEPAFGVDFSAVRVHHGSDANQTARRMGARAASSGADIVFGAGQYRPDTGEGMHLLAHELTHLVQQSPAAPRAIVPVHPAPRGAVQLATNPSSLPVAAGAAPAPDFQILERTQPGLARELEAINVRLLNEILIPVGQLTDRLRLFPEYGVLDPDKLQLSTVEYTYDFYSRKVLSSADPRTVANLVHAMLDVSGAPLQKVITRLRIRAASQDPELGEAVAALEELRMDVLLRTQALLKYSYVQTGEAEEARLAPIEAEERREAFEAAAPERERQAAAADLERRVDYVCRDVFRAGYPEIDSGAARMGSIGLAHWFVRTEKLDGAGIAEVLEGVRALDEGLFRAALYMNHLIRRLREDYDIKGLEAYEGLTSDPEQEAGEYLLKSVADAILGDFSEDPTALGIVLGSILTLIPGLDTAGDVRDLAAALYQLVWEGMVDDPGVWLSLILTLVGFVPEAGTVIKGLTKLAVKGLENLPIAAILKLLPEGAEAGDILTEIRRFLSDQPSWEPRIASALEGILAKLDEYIAPLRAAAQDKVDRLRAAIARARSAAIGMTPPAVRAMVSQIDTFRRGLVETLEGAPELVGEATGALLKKAGDVRRRLLSITPSGRDTLEWEALQQEIYEMELAALERFLERERLLTQLESVESQVVDLERRVAAGGSGKLPPPPPPVSAAPPPPPEPPRRPPPLPEVKPPPLPEVKPPPLPEVKPPSDAPPAPDLSPAPDPRPELESLPTPGAAGKADDAKAPTSAPPEELPAGPSDATATARRPSATPDALKKTSDNELWNIVNAPNKKKVDPEALLEFERRNEVAQMSAEDLNRLLSDANADPRLVELAEQEQALRGQIAKNYEEMKASGTLQEHIGHFPPPDAETIAAGRAIYGMMSRAGIQRNRNFAVNIGRRSNGTFVVTLSGEADKVQEARRALSLPPPYEWGDDTVPFKRDPRVLRPDGSPFPGGQHCAEPKLYLNGDLENPVESMATIWYGKTNPYPLPDRASGAGSFMEPCYSCRQHSGRLVTLCPSIRG